MSDDIINLVTLAFRQETELKLKADLETQEEVDIQLHSCQQARRCQLHGNISPRPSCLVLSSALFAAPTTNLLTLQLT